MTVAEIKDTVRKRDGYRCTECGISNEEHRQKTGRSLDVHRLSPGSVYTVEGCITLCRRCHGPHPKRTRGTPDLSRPNHRPLHFYISHELSEAIHRYRDSLEFKPTLTCIVATMLKEFLAKRSFWPPRDAAD